MRRALVTAATTLLVASCNLGPDYHRPAIDTPEAFRDAETARSLADVKWFDLFQDPVLRDLIDAGLAGNKDLLAATWRIEQARAELGIVRSELYPSFTFQAGASRTKPSDQTRATSDEKVDDYSAYAGVSWEVDLWGRFRRANEAARAELLAAEWGRRALVVSLVAEIARGYFLLRDLDQRLEVSVSTLESRHGSTELIRERFKGGIVSEVDVHQAEIQEATAAAAVPAFRREVARVEHALSVLLGRNPGPIPRGAALAEQTLPEHPPAGLPSELLQRRPDVRRTEDLVHAEMARIGVAQALRWPSLSLTGVLGLQSEELADFTSGDTWSVGADLFAPLFQFGRNKRRVQAQRARTEAAILGYEVTVLDAFREVEDALVAIQTLREEHEARTEQVRAASAAQRLSRARYDGGVTSYLEVLDIERSLFQAELDASRTLQENLSAIVDLYAALGGGWDPDEPFQLPASRIVEE